MTDLRQELMRGEQWTLEVRTSDPQNPAADERWIRSDLDSGDKIATYRTGDGTDMPIYPTGTAEDTVSEAIRIEVSGQTGYVPIAPESDAEFQSRQVQHNGQRYAHHNSVSPGAGIPDKFIEHGTFNDDAGDINSGDTISIGSGFFGREILIAVSGFFKTNNPPSVDGNTMTEVARGENGPGDSFFYRFRDDGDLGSSVTYDYDWGRKSLHRVITTSAFTVVDSSTGNDLSGSSSGRQLYTHTAANGSSISSLTDWDDFTISSQDINSNEFTVHAYNDPANNFATNVNPNPTGGSDDTAVAITIEKI